MGTCFFRNEKHEIIGYRQEDGDRVQIRTKEGELGGWTDSGQTRKADGTIASFQQNEGRLYKDLR